MIHRRDFSNPPDVVAYPRDEDEIRAVLDWCGASDLAAIPYGGGSSVVGGVNPPTDERYRGTVTIDLKDTVGAGPAILKSESYNFHRLDLTRQVGFAVTSLAAQGGQRLPSYFNIHRGNPILRLASILL
jgi:hypothetical protein